MTFDEWHDNENKPYENGEHCPHIDWERAAWNASRQNMKDEILRGLRSENNTTQLRAIIAQVELL
jgi:hypothetical protein